MRPNGDATVETVKIGVLDVEVAMLQALATALGMVVVLEMEWTMFPPKSAVEEALKIPETWRPAPIELDALEMKPPNRVERFLTNKVLDALRAPEI